MKFYQMAIEQVAQILGTDSNKGLTLEQVQQGLKKYGYNKRANQNNKSLFSLLFNQCKDPLFYFLIASSVIIFFAGSIFDSVIILMILLLNIILKSQIRVS